jgi:hypothetical protein
MHGTDKRMSQPEAMKTNAYVGGVVISFRKAQSA